MHSHMNDTKHPKMVIFYVINVNKMYQFVRLTP